MSTQAESLGEVELRQAREFVLEAFQAMQVDNSG
jgi:hypothetical protein